MLHNMVKQYETSYFFKEHIIAQSFFHFGFLNQEGCRMNLNSNSSGRINVFIIPVVYMTLFGGSICNELFQLNLTVS